MERTNSDTLRWAVVFSDGVINVDASDFDVDGTTASLTITSVDTYLDSVYYATLSGGDLPDLNGTVTINIAHRRRQRHYRHQWQPTGFIPAHVEQKHIHGHECHTPAPPEH